MVRPLATPRPWRGLAHRSRRTPGRIPWMWLSIWPPGQDCQQENSVRTLIRCDLCRSSTERYPGGDIVQPSVAGNVGHNLGVDDNCRPTSACPRRTTSINTKVAIVTGAGSGVGWASAIALLKEGRRRACRRLHGEPAAGSKRPLSDGDGHDDALRGPRLTGFGVLAPSRRDTGSPLPLSSTRTRPDGSRPAARRSHGATTLGHESYGRSGLGERRQTDQARCLTLSASKGGYYLDSEQTPGPLVSGRSDLERSRITSVQCAQGFGARRAVNSTGGWMVYPPPLSIVKRMASGVTWPA